MQKNRGVESAKTNSLLFLHVDTEVSQDSVNKIEELLRNGCVGGCLTLKIEDDRLIFRIFERLVNFFAKRFNFIDGELGQFVKKEEFLRIGGFEKVKKMEDILFGRKLAKKTGFKILPQKIKASSRKWNEKGILNLLKEYTDIYVRYFLGRLESVN